MKISKPRQDLIDFVSTPAERANEDLALSYFRSYFKNKFTRQQDAANSDGYVPGNLVLELKGKTNDWLPGFFQGLAYGRELDYVKVVVIAQDFLGLWYLSEIDQKLVDEAQTEKGAPNAVGKRLASRYKAKRKEILSNASYHLDSSLLPYKQSLFSKDSDVLGQSLDSFEYHLKNAERQRIRVTIKNFTSVLKEMSQFFDETNPLQPVRAFYSIIFGWDESSKVSISNRRMDSVSVAGETVTGLIPDRRHDFKTFIEDRYIPKEDSANKDLFFSSFDRALDAVHPEFRIKHGIFFTDLNLSRFAMWMVRRELGDIGDKYMVIDPACGSGNLVTNWRSPMELRHKVVSEIEPELLFAVERRMLGDEWHNGKFTVVPKVAESKGLNFLDISAKEYLDVLKHYLDEKQLKPDKPIAFLCNPPYRSDDDQSAEAIKYEVHKSIVELTGNDAANERYCCFLAQMKLICEQAESSGIPGDSLLFLFTKAAWFTSRPVFKTIRSNMLRNFENLGAIIVNGKEFFSLKGKFPIAFSIWRYSGENLDEHRPINVKDLTWIKKTQLESIDWDNELEYEKSCEDIYTDRRSIVVPFGVDRDNIKKWADQTSKDFKRDRRKNEKGKNDVGGLPVGDPRRKNKKTYGELDGKYIGFMDDLTPCRIKYGNDNKPWFRLNNQFMDCRKTRCYSGPATHFGFCATDRKVAEKLFTWFSLARTFASEGYPMWVDAMEMWGIKLTDNILQDAFAIGLAENECVETFFPANDPIAGTKSISISNPMSPNSSVSFWNAEMDSLFKKGNSKAHELVSSVKNLYREWENHLGDRHVCSVSYETSYFISGGKLTKNAGLIQIREFAKQKNVQSLQSALANIQELLASVKKQFYVDLLSDNSLNYFGAAQAASGRRPGKALHQIERSEKTKFQETLDKRIALSSFIVNELHNDRNFGRTKLEKALFLSEYIARFDLQSNYYREAAGPLDQRALYNEKIGIESLAQSRGAFEVVSAKALGKGATSKMIKYSPGPKIVEFVGDFNDSFGTEEQRLTIRQLIELIRPMTTDQVEIFATLYACWNDLLIEKKGKEPTVFLIQNEFLNNWHEKKKRFTKEQLKKAIAWMRKNHVVPSGSGKKTLVKIDF